MSKRLLIACMLTGLAAWPAMAADLSRDGYGARRYDRTYRQVPVARLVPDCREGDDPLVLGCDPRAVLPPGPEFDDLRKRYVELSVARRLRPYRELFNWNN